MDTSTTNSVVSRAYNLFSNLFGLRPATPRQSKDTDIVSSDNYYSVKVFKKGIKNLTYLSVFTTDSPAVVAAKIAESNPDYCDNGYRVWISDPRCSNPDGARFRFTRTANGQPVARLIDPRTR